MATYRVVRRQGPMEVPQPAPVAAAPAVQEPIRVSEPHVWIDYGPPGAQCSRCGADRQDSGGLACFPREQAADTYFPGVTWTTDAGTYRRDAQGRLLLTISEDTLARFQHYDRPAAEVRAAFEPPAEPQTPREPRTLLELLEEDDD